MQRAITAFLFGTALLVFSSASGFAADEPTFLTAAPLADGAFCAAESDAPAAPEAAFFEAPDLKVCTNNACKQPCREQWPTCAAVCIDLQACICESVCP